MELASQNGSEAIFQAGSRLAGHRLFQLLMEFNSADLGGKPSLANLMACINSLAKIQQSRAQSDLLGERAAKERRVYEEAKAAADRKAQALLSRKGVGPEVINRIRSIYGLPVLGEAAQ
jgi:hypothetical protein